MATGTCRLVHHLAPTEISQQLFDGLPWHSLQTGIVPRGCFQMTLAVLSRLLQRHHEVDICGFERNISKCILVDCHEICTPNLHKDQSKVVYAPWFCLRTNSFQLITSLHVYFLCSAKFPRFWVQFFFLVRDYLCHLRCPNKVVENQVNLLACLQPDWSPDTALDVMPCSQVSVNAL